MLKSKKLIEKWAKEIVRCEQVLSDKNSTQEQIRQAEWKIESIMELYGSDFEATMLLVVKIEELMFSQTFDKW